MTNSNPFYTEIWGYMGGFFLFIVLVPQVYKTYQTMDVNGISSSFLFFEFMASVCFIVYGFLLPNNSGLPMVVSNASALLCTIALVVAKVKYSGSPEKIEENLLSN